MSSRAIWLPVGVFGVIMTALGFLTMSHFPAEGHAIDQGYGGPVFAFEMAKTSGDLIAVFGPESDPQRLSRIEQMDLGNCWDFPFMLAYSLFLASFAFAAWKETGSRLWIAIIGLALLSGCADAVENKILLDITADMQAAPGMGWLGIPVWTKFLSIMLCVCASGIYITSQKHLLWRLFGIAAVIGGSEILIAFFSPSDFGWLIRPGTTVGWIVMLVLAWTWILRPAAQQ